MTKHPPGTAQKRFAAHAHQDPAEVAELDRDHPALVENRTLFPSRVFDDPPRILVSGHNSRKIGKMVTKGEWKGMPIYTLTLEERATCDPNCWIRASCYGTGMPFARRVRNSYKFECDLVGEVADLAKDHPQGFVVRLHVLGDFYSVRYVEIWRQLLEYVPALHVFGYTNRSDEIADAVAAMNWQFRGRCLIRYSRPYPTQGGATVIEYMPAGSRCAEGLVCPVEQAKTTSCGECGLCWAPAARDECIVFVKHGPTWSGRGHKR